MKRLFSYLIVFLLTQALPAHAEDVLEVGSLQSFQVQEVAASPPTLKLSGLVFQSALGIHRIDLLRHQDSLQVVVRLALASKGRSGNLDYTLVVPDTVRTVTFGTAQTIIWQLETGK